MRAVLDSNVLISSVFWLGKEYKIFQKAIKGDFGLLTSQAILRELERVMSKKFAAPFDKIEETIRLIVANATVIEPKRRLGVIKEDESDNRVLECAVEGKANYVVTGDKHLLKLGEYRDIPILRCKDFLKLFEE